MLVGVVQAMQTIEGKLMGAIKEYIFTSGYAFTPNKMEEGGGQVELCDVKFSEKCPSRTIITLL